MLPLACPAQALMGEGFYGGLWVCGYDGLPGAGEHEALRVAGDDLAHQEFVVAGGNMDVIGIASDPDKTPLCGRLGWRRCRTPGNLADAVAAAAPVRDANSTAEAGEKTASLAYASRTGPKHHLHRRALKANATSGIKTRHRLHGNRHR